MKIDLKEEQLNMIKVVFGQAEFNGIRMALSDVVPLLQTIDITLLQNQPNDEGKKKIDDET